MHWDQASDTTVIQFYPVTCNLVILVQLLYGRLKKDYEWQIILQFGAVSFLISEMSLKVLKSSNPSRLYLKSIYRSDKETMIYTLA